MEDAQPKRPPATPPHDDGDSPHEPGARDGNEDDLSAALAELSEKVDRRARSAASRRIPNNPEAT